MNDTQLGQILLAMGAITVTQLEAAVADQVRLNVPLGKVLLARGDCTDEQLEIALKAQKDTRSGKRISEALAWAKIAILRKDRNDTRSDVIEQGKKLRESAEFQTITEDMLVK
jgi:hypothetical protein